MKIIALGRYAMGICAVALVAACSSGGLQLAPAEAARQQQVIFHPSLAGLNAHVATDDGDLVYVGQGTKVDMYSFPRITKNPVGTIQVPESGLCSDSNGNVWIASQVGKSYEMIEYPHGGTNPITQLSAGGVPRGCSVDSKSGDLAVANNGLTSQGGYVAVYRKAEGNPQIFSDPNVSRFYYCTYDKSGNLLAQGWGPTNNVVYAELIKGHQKLQDVDGIVAGASPAGVQWDGAYFVVGYSNINTLYRYTITTGQATLEGQTTFDPAGTFSLVGFAIDGTRLAGTSKSSNFYRLSAFSYPGGGKSSHHHLITLPVGLALSVAPHP